jgi:hypothetical protein
MEGLCSASWKGNLRVNLRENAEPLETRRVRIVVAALDLGT